jgi:hypothetical protein
MNPQTAEIIRALADVACLLGNLVSIGLAPLVTVCLFRIAFRPPPRGDD